MEFAPKILGENSRETSPFTPQINNEKLLVVCAKKVEKMGGSSK